ncbi:MAG: hypothetical protein ACREGR_02870, partial [Minisyncoccia bacterium]
MAGSTSTTAFSKPLDIGRRACQVIGARLITSMDPTVDQSQAADEIATCYDKVRLAELERNNWVFATKDVILRAIDSGTYMLVPAAYDATKTYLLGSIVEWTDGNIYIATGAVALATPPGAGPPWTQYFGPMTVSGWGLDTTAGQSGQIPPLWLIGTTYATGDAVLGSDGNTYSSISNGNVGNNPVGDNNVHWLLTGTASVTAYFAGELVYFPATNPTTVYLSLFNGNSLAPSAVPQYDPTIAYKYGATVQYSSVTYQSTTDLNLGNTPTGSAPWVTVPLTQATKMIGTQWLELDATVQSITLLYPVGSGPVEQSATRNVFMLPNGFLRKAPTDPKAGSFSYLGAPGNILYDDWVFADNFIVSSQVDPLFLRFVADIADVFSMHPLFCEG